MINKIETTINDLYLGVVEKIIEGVRNDENIPYFEVIEGNRFTIEILEDIVPYIDDDIIATHKIELTHLSFNNEQIFAHYSVGADKLDITAPIKWENFGTHLQNEVIMGYYCIFY